MLRLKQHAAHLSSLPDAQKAILRNLVYQIKAVKRLPHYFHLKAVLN